MNKTSIKRSSFGLCLALVSCVYTSEYTPPRDGRARVVWRDNRMVTTLAGGILEPDCARAVERLAHVDTLELADSEIPKGGTSARAQVRQLEPGEFWQPRFAYAKKGIPDGKPFPTGAKPFPMFATKLAAPATAQADAARGSFWSAAQQGVLYPLGFAGEETPGFGAANMVLLFIGPFTGIGALYPGLVATGSPGAPSMAANQAAAYNDLVRTPGSACAEKSIGDTNEDVEP